MTFNNHQSTKFQFTKMDEAGQKIAMDTILSLSPGGGTNI